MKANVLVHASSVGDYPVVLRFSLALAAQTSVTLLTAARAASLNLTTWTMGQGMTTQCMMSSVLVL